MSQQHFKFGSYTAPDPDDDGYQLAFATTSTENSGRIMRGNMINTPMFTVEAYNLKWTDISAIDVMNILSQILGKSQFDFYHFNALKCRWETSPFYVANINSPFYRLNEGQERANELSFQVTAINPVR